MTANEAKRIVELKGYTPTMVAKAMNLKSRGLRDNYARNPLRAQFALQIMGLPDLVPGESFDCEEQYFCEVGDMKGVDCEI